MKTAQLVFLSLLMMIVSACDIARRDIIDPVQKPAITAIAVLEEKSSLDIESQTQKTDAEFSMAFIKKSESAKRIARRLIGDNASRGPFCESQTKSISRSMKIEYVSGGQVEFFPVSESTALVATEDASHFYSKRLQGRIPDGVYQVTVAGFENVPPFKSLFSLPGRIEEGRLSGTSLTDKIGAIKKSEGVFIEWKNPSFGTKRSILIADLLGAIDEKTAIHVQCLALESDFDQGQATLKWTLPKAFVSELPTTVVGKFGFARAHLEKPDKIQNIDIELQGIRTQWLEILIGE